MKFNASVAVWNPGMEECAYGTHAAHAERLCRKGLARRISKSVIELMAGIAQIKLETEPAVVRAMANFAQKRGKYHQHTRPNVDRKTSPTFFYRARTGQMSGAYPVGVGFSKQSFDRTREAAA